VNLTYTNLITFVIDFRSVRNGRMRPLRVLQLHALEADLQRAQKRTLRKTQRKASGRVCLNNLMLNVKNKTCNGTHKFSNTLHKWSGNVSAQRNNFFINVKVSLFLWKVEAAFDSSAHNTSSEFALKVT
jgi:hypothetical protein